MHSYPLQIEQSPKNLGSLKDLSVRNLQPTLLLVWRAVIRLEAILLVEEEVHVRSSA